ncbi:MAG: endonuclease/exonuclease/phosphatase family protein [Bacteriovoracaceae bacterium]|nr:endonuclease/exonuclease/phosphatase family protein [Bacteriovoracaceae bacterium]
MKKIGIIFLSFFISITKCIAYPTLKVVSYNLGLLNGPIAYVPLYQSRSEKLQEKFSQFLSKEEPDIISLQELWYEHDQKKILSLALQYGYLPLENNLERAYHHGLQILVKKSLLNLQAMPAMQSFFWPYLNDDGEPILLNYESLYGFTNWHTYRGILGTILPFKNAGQTQWITILNTHLSSGDVQSVRLAQIEAGAKKLSDPSLDLRITHNPIIFCGDFNFSPDDLEHEEIKKLGFVDTLNILSPRGNTLTWHRQNILTHHFDDPDERLDYIFVKGLNGVIDSKLIFTETFPVMVSQKDFSRKFRAVDLSVAYKLGTFIYNQFNRNEMELDINLSDHYGITSTLKLD